MCDCEFKLVMSLDQTHYTAEISSDTLIFTGCWHIRDLKHDWLLCCFQIKHSELVKVVLVVLLLYMYTVSVILTLACVWLGYERNIKVNTVILEYYSLFGNRQRHIIFILQICVYLQRYVASGLKVTAATTPRCMKTSVELNKLQNRNNVGVWFCLR